MKLEFTIDKKYDKGMAKSRFPDEVLKKVDADYRTSLPFLELTKKLYQKSWNEINQEFSDYIERETDISGSIQNMNVLFL